MKISYFAILAVRVSMKTSENWFLEYWADNKTSVTACCRNWLKQWWPSMNWYLSSVVPASLECVCFCDKLYGFTLFFVVTFPCCCWLQWAYKLCCIENCKCSLWIKNGQTTWLCFAEWRGCLAPQWWHACWDCWEWLGVRCHWRIRHACWTMRGTRVHSADLRELHLLLHSTSNFMDSRTVKMSGCKAGDIQYNEGRGARIKVRFFLMWTKNKRKSILVVYQAEGRRVNKNQAFIWGFSCSCW